jgi:hypothetical protein
VAQAHDFDPVTAIAIIHHESHWTPGAISPDGEDYGLGQVRARFVGACLDDADPLAAPSEACLAVKQKLLSPDENIKAMGRIIAKNREFCVKMTGKGDKARWLAGYQGYNSPSKKEWCKSGDLTKEVLDYEKDLLAKISPKKKHAPGAAGGKNPPPLAKEAPKAPGKDAHGKEPTKAQPKGEPKKHAKAPAKAKKPAAKPKAKPKAKVAKKAPPKKA